MTHSDPARITDNHPEVQARFAAWLVSLGRQVCPESAATALRDLGSWSFAAFISECKAIAQRRGFGVGPDGRVGDHDAFTTICETEARWRRLGGSLAQVA